MTNTNIIYGLLFLIVLMIYLNRDWLQFQLLFFLIPSRGILAPNRFWWFVSDLLLKDTNGVELYRRLTHNKPAIQKYNVVGNKIHVVSNIEYIKKILDNSPNIFGVGKIKIRFFKSFMSKNVGVSQFPEWPHRREVNEYVLDTDNLHRFADHYHQYIIDQIKTTQSHPPRNFDEFNQLARKITMKIVFGTNQVHPEIFKLFEKANNFIALLKPDGIDLSDTPEMKFYIQFLKKNINHPQPHSLIDLLVQKEKSTEEMIHQIPHWIFPTVALINTHLPRLLLTLHHHPHILLSLQKLINSPTFDITNLNQIWQYYEIRAIILEQFRLSNAVSTTFRTLLSPTYQFSPEYQYSKGDQFLVLNNPVMRNSKYFKNPDLYQPNRWNPSLEKKYYAIMFNQGPQRCPGKDLAIFVLTSYLVSFIRYLPPIQSAKPKINTQPMPQLINPFSIQFKYN